VAGAVLWRPRRKSGWNLGKEYKNIFFSHFQLSFCLMRTIHGEIPTCACATFSSLCKCWIAVVMSSCSFCSCWLSEILANRSCEFSGTPFYMTILQKLHNAFWEVLTYIRTYIIIYIYRYILTPSC
jgi:hypothetical protein